jgi:hypothetical protein
MIAGKKISGCVHVSNPKTLEFPFIECVKSLLPIVDELIIVNGDKDFDGEVYDLLTKNTYTLATYKNIIKVINLPMSDLSKKNIYMIAKSAGIFNCTGDYILPLDADEVLHEQDYPKIEEAVKLGHDAYAFRVLHFYRDYTHIKISDYWYSYRPYLFKNGLGIFDGYRSDIIDGKLVTEFYGDYVTFDYKAVMPFTKKTSIRAFHYGYVRNEKCMLDKFNNMELKWHPNGETLKTKWEWDMQDTEEYTKTHPEVMKNRINLFNKE